MAKKTRRVSVPSIAQIKRDEGIGKIDTGTPYERAYLGGVVKSAGGSNRVKGPSGSSQAARVKAQRGMSYDTALAIQAAKEGDDSELLPYQPTPSINPPRPRTLAAGYDPDTKVMRVRFRDGAVYGYAGVSPSEWRNFKRVKSPGRSINRTFNHKEYWREPWT